MATDLVAFLRARLDEDEAAARAAFSGPWRYNPRKLWNAPPPALGVVPPGEEFVAAGPLNASVCVAATGPADEPQSMADAAHIARWDPARVLAEVKAKRRIVDHLAAYQPGVPGVPDVCPEPGSTARRSSRLRPRLERLSRD